MYENKRELCEKTILRNIVAVCHTAQKKVDGDCFLFMRYRIVPEHLLKHVMI